MSIEPKFRPAKTAQAVRAGHFKLKPSSRLITLLFAFGATSNVFAQATTDVQPSTAKNNVLETVVITGTLIRGANPVGTPVIGLGRDEIIKSGAGSTVDLLRQLPQIQNLGADEGHLNAAQNANQNISVGSGVNLRGLGPESTLTLVNGRRIAPGGLGAQYTDPSTIPPLAIDRIEVITDGGSATYGSDAVGGVVNMRLRKNFEGAEVSVRHGSGKDVHQNQIGAIFGKSWDSGNFMFAVDQNNRSRLGANDRKFFTDDMRPWGGPDLRGFNANPGNVQVGATRYAIPAGQNGVGLTANRLVAGTANLQSIYKGVDALPEQKRFSALGSLTQSLTDTIAVSLEVFSTERKYRRTLAAPSGNITVRNTNPFFVSPVPGATSTTVNYSYYNDFGNSTVTGFERSDQIAAGLDFEVGGDWNGSAYVTHSTTQERYLGLNANGINVNAQAAAVADTNPLTALNAFCDGSRFTCNNPATLDKMRAFNDRNSKYILNDAGIKFDGPLYSLPAGKLRMAVGAEVHSDRMPYFEDRTNSSLLNASGYPTIFHIDNSKAVPHRTVRSFYAEAYIPLIGAANAVPGVQKLELSLAGRYEDYSDFGTTSNPKVGLDWTPMQGVKLHATYGTSFRAPTLGDIDPINGGVINVVDRVDANGVTQVHGLALLGGNPAGLKPETADIYTVGLNFKPASVQGLDVTLDYFNINYKNRILVPGNDVSILQKPELAAYVNRNPTPAEISVLIATPTYSGSPTEAVSGIKFIQDGRRYNAGVVKTSGLDFSARYLMQSSIGIWNTGLSINYIFNYKQQFTPTSALVSGLLNTLNNPMRLRARGELGWSSDAWRVNSFINFTNRYHNTTLVKNPNVASYTTLDVTARYDFSKVFHSDWVKGLSASLSVLNLTDRDPPYVQNATQAFDPQNVSAIGRFTSLTLNKQW